MVVNNRGTVNDSWFFMAKEHVFNLEVMKERMVAIAAEEGRRLALNQVKTLEEVVESTSAAAIAAPDADLYYLNVMAGPGAERAVASAVRLVQAGRVGAVKLEGGKVMIDVG